jgi:ribosomal protein L7Ae-like RNA K-turn-binding protein
MVCLRNALKPATLASAFRRPVGVPTVETVRRTAVALLYERLGACLGMAQRAGAVISGYASLRRAFVHANIVCMVLATDIATPRGEEYRLWCAQQGIPCLTFFTKENLGSRIGRAQRSAVGLTEPRFRELLLTTWALLEKLCSDGAFAGAKAELPQSSS